MEDRFFDKLRNIKKRIKDHYRHMDNVRSQRERDELRISIMRLENSITEIAGQVDWGKYDFSECVFMDLQDKIHDVAIDKLSFVEVSHVWLIFDHDGRRLKLDLNRDDFNIDFLDRIKPSQERRSI